VISKNAEPFLQIKAYRNGTVGIKQFRLKVRNVSEDKEKIILRNFKKEF
jgi:hypothetical protein